MTVTRRRFAQFAAAAVAQTSRIARAACGFVAAETEKAARIIRFTGMTPD